MEKVDKLKKQKREKESDAAVKKSFTASISFRRVFGNRDICLIVVFKDESIHVQLCANVFGYLFIVGVHSLGSCDCIYITVVSLVG